MSYHMFNVQVAKLAGVPCAIFLEHLKFWILKNLAEGRHIHDGNCWSYSSRKGFAIIFPYYTDKQLRTIIDKCVALGLVVKGNYNRSPYDRTSWYALTPAAWEMYPELDQKLLETPEISIGPYGPIEDQNMANEKAPKGQPIPDKETDKETDTTTSSGDFDSQSEEEEEVIDKKQDTMLWKATQGKPIHAKDRKEFLLWCKFFMDHLCKASDQEGKMRVLVSIIKKSGLTKPKGYEDSVQTKTVYAHEMPKCKHVSDKSTGREFLENIKAHFNYQLA